MRDHLIANRENLLNTRRCLFKADSEVIPGGCAPPEVIVSGLLLRTPHKTTLMFRLWSCASVSGAGFGFGCGESFALWVELVHGAL